MNKTKIEIISKNFQAQNNYFLAPFFLAMLFILSVMFFPPFPYLDGLTSVFLLAILAYFSKKANLSPSAKILLTLAIIMHLAGAFGLYAYFIIEFVGYDKAMHLFASFAVAYGLLDYFNDKYADNSRIKYVLIVLIVLGAGAIIEINEFIGTVFFGIDNGGIFAIGDGLPVTRSILQTYDTYFDMIFNFFGALFAIIFCILTKKYNSMNVRIETK